MSGIVFYKTQKLDELRVFYDRIVGSQLWLNQGDCLIFRHGNFLFGFCAGEKNETESILTFFYPTKSDVDELYMKMKDMAAGEPSMNNKYRIYHFFAHDPEGRSLEFQCFNHDLDGYLAGDELLMTRRSVREFDSRPVSDEVFGRIVELTRFAPTSRNSQSFYFKPIRDPRLLEQIAAVRGKSSSPIAKAPMAVVICSDPIISQRHIQDGCIGAYHFLLAAWFCGLGTVWIAAMDREDVKQLLDIPPQHYIATITPLGFPREYPAKPPLRKPIEWYLR